MLGVVDVRANVGLLLLLLGDVFVGVFGGVVVDVEPLASSISDDKFLLLVSKLANTVLLIFFK